MNTALNNRVEDSGKTLGKGISVVLNTYNAEQHLKRVLDSVKDFDEIVVCDMESTDSTRSIAEEFGAKVVIFPKGEHKICEPARDFAIHSASNDWVLVVDADELVPEGLRKYLYRRVEKGLTGALAIPRINMFIGKSAHETPDRQLRFFRQSAATWPPVIHARPQTEGPVENVPASDPELSLIHLDDASLSSRFDKMNRYSEYEVPKRMHRHFSGLALLFRPLWFFLKSYIIGGGWRDGRRGILNSYNHMIYQLMLMGKVTEAQMRKNSAQKG